MKSPIYESFVAFEGHLPLLDRMAQYVTDDCGTHIHVQVSREVKVRLQRKFSHVFHDIVWRMLCCPDETEEFWGRISNEWAEITSTSNGRYVWVNLHSDKPTLEFRLPMYHNSRQFSRVVCFVRDLVDYLERELCRPRSAEAYERISLAVCRLYKQAVDGD
jgi:hypothetical protein